MGAVCSGGITKANHGFQVHAAAISEKLKSVKSFNKYKEEEEDTYSSYQSVEIYENNQERFDPLDLHIISRELKPSVPIAAGSTKVPQTGSFLGRAGIAGLEKAVDVLDLLGSSVSNLNRSSDFISVLGVKNNKISILAFEIANTIAKGANLMQSLSKENVEFLKKDVLHSVGVELLVSTDMKELLSIAAADKREEFKVFSREVIRFGNLCKDPQWHNLGRFFSILDSDRALHRKEDEGVEKNMHQLTSLARHTSDLYHELNALDRFEDDFRRKVEEMESLNLPRKGESVMLLQSELKHQRKLIRSLKKNSLWSKSLEEVVEKLVEIVIFIHQEILEVFEDKGLSEVGKDPGKKPDRLGAAGLALHYANLINQIDSIASRPMALPPTMRDTLYQSLPPSVKAALRPRCQSADTKELTIPQIKAEMEKTLRWLVPVATNTTKAHQGFGWVGEWANTGNEASSKKGCGLNSIVRLQTLYHANKQKMDQYILELVTFLHQLIGSVRQRDIGIRTTHQQLISRFPSCKVVTKQRMAVVPVVVVEEEEKVESLQSVEDRCLLEEMNGKKKRKVYGRSKSQDIIGLPNKRWTKEVCDLKSSKSADNSPKREFTTTVFVDDTRI
ncbi:protein PSK SIMULATOR 2-like isoform X2 [Impatiens glandulifera]|uniref:protein PSK SIMULATOR 2-like isoform X2 n=1 Tax=Impatiens glandulifera TaxID=253017 RepID=UPI001FB0DB52|nr:protein PSK SIMULATOR 2-like isoform X2 [Impatiens glandulifera]